VADLDTSSKSGDTDFVSYLLRGKLTLHGEDGDFKQAEIDFDSEPARISTEYSFGGRGMEISELVVFNGKLYSCDDRTGIVYEVLDYQSKPRVVPWVILVDGDGKNSSKGSANTLKFEYDCI
jgi:soluble calcium-activated nucleotidase 1